MAATIQALVIEDSPHDAELMVAELVRVGYDPDWRRVDSEPDLLAGLESSIDVVLAGDGLPRLRTLRALQLLRERAPDVPFVIVNKAMPAEVAVECLRRGAFDCVPRERIRRLGPTVGQALEQQRQRLEAERAREALVENEQQALRLAREEGALAEIGRIVGSSLDINQVYRQFAEAVRTILPWDWIGVLLHGGHGDVLVSAYSAGEGVPSSGPVPMEGSVAGEAIRTRSALAVLTETPAELLARFPGVSPALADRGRSIICAPLTFRGSVTGALSLLTREPQAYGERHVALAERVAAQIAGAIGNAALLATVNRHAREEAVLAEIGRIVESSADVDEVYEPFAEAVAELVPWDRMAITTVEQGAGTFVERYVGGPRIGGRGPGCHVPLAGSVTAHLVETRRPLAWRADRDGDLAARFPGAAPVLDSGVRSVVAVPLTVSDRAVGALHFDSFSSDAYGEDSVRLAERVAAQIAGAIGNAALRATVDRQARQEEALAGIGRIISSSSDIDEVFERFAGRARAVLPFERASIATVDHERGLMRTRYVAGLQIQALPRGRLRPLSEQGAFEEVARTGRAIRVDDLREVLDRYLRAQVLVDAGLRAAVYAPLTSEGVVIGTLAVASSQVGAYTDDDLSLLVRIADQIAGAVAIADLHEDVGRRAREEAALASMGRIIASSPNLDAGLEDFARVAAELIPWDRISITTVDEEADAFVERYVGGPVIAGRGVGHMVPLPGSVTRRLLETRKPFLIEDTDRDARVAARFPQLAVVIRAGTRSLVAAPLLVSGRAVGALHFHSFSRGAYDERHAGLAERIASQIAGAIGNAELRARLDRQAREESALAEISRIASSVVSIEGVFARLAELIAQLIPLERLSIDTVDLEAAAFTIRYVWGTGVGEREVGATIPLEASMTGAVVDIGHSFLIADPDEDADLTERLPRLVPGLAAGLRSFLSVPMVFRDRVAGVLHLGSSVANAFTPAHVRLAERIAAQIAGTVANTALREDVERRAREEAALAEIGRIITSSPDIDEVYQVFVERVRAVIPADRIVITTIDFRRGLFTALYQWGAAVEGRPRGEWAPFAGTLTAHVAESRRPFLHASERDAVSFAERFPGIRPTLEAGFLSVIAVPLVAGDAVSGVLLFEAYAAAAFGERDLAFAERVGDQVAGAIAVAGLHADAERQAREGAALAEIGRIVSSTLDIEEVFERFTGQVRRLIPADLVSLTVADRDAGTFTIVHRWGHEVPGADRGAVFPMDGSLTGHVMSTGSALMLTDSRGDAEPERRFPALTLSVAAGLRSFIAAPLAFRDQPFGALHIWSLQPDAYRAEHTALAERVAAQVAGVIASARLHEDLAVMNESLEERVDARTRELRDANAELEELAYSIAHDVRGPLRVSAGFSRALMEDYGDALPEGAVRYLDLIAQGAVEAGALMDDLLELTRVGRATLATQPIEPATIARGVMEDLLSEEAGRRVQVDYGKTPECLADPTLLRQVYRNLLGNALKFTKTREPAKVEVASRVVNGETAYYVRDNGVGFSMEHAGRIFEVFERLHRPEEYPGTGAGLAIVARAVGRHGGRVWCEAEVDRGATFYFTIGNGKAP